MASPTPGLRREPVQKRSARRVSAMLDACAEILAERGYDGLTTTLVAERAGVAIGSVYQFFPDKRALALAVADRNLQAYVERVRERFANSSFADWREALDAAFDEYVDMHRTVVGFTAIQFGEDIETRVARTERQKRVEVAELMVDMLCDGFDITPPQNLQFVLTNAVEVGHALFGLAFRRDPQGDAETIAEAKWLIVTYLSRYLPDG